MTPLSTIPRLEVETNALELTAESAPWDSVALAMPSAMLSRFRINIDSQPLGPLTALWNWTAEHGIKFISARLPQSSICESLLLERQGFNCIDMALHPHLTNLGTFDTQLGNLDIKPAPVETHQRIVDGARCSFGIERFHSDPRISKQAADARYANWVASTLSSRPEQVLAINSDNKTVGFFQYSYLAPDQVHWELTAIFPEFQGSGIGFRSWLSVLRFHQAQGINTVTTSISARNHRVLNLYAKLGFRFLEPEINLHWLKEH